MAKESGGGMNNRDVGAELLIDLADHIFDMLTGTGMQESDARAIANETAAKIADNWGGQSVYIPMDLVARMSTRNAEILDAFTGNNITELVRKFRLSRQAIYRIVKAERQRRSPKQGSLFQNM